MKRYFDANASGKVMLWNIKKVMYCHFADLPTRLSALVDPRKFVEYTIEEMMMSAIVLFIFGCNSRNAFNNKAREENFCNYSPPQINYFAQIFLAKGLYGQREFSLIYWEKQIKK